MKPLCLGAWKGGLLKDNHDLACKSFPGKEQFSPVCAVNDAPTLRRLYFLPF